MGETKPKQITETKLKRVAQLSGENPMMEFIGLMPHVNKESLIGCFHELDGRKAVGIDRMTKEAYGKDLERNIDSLLTRMRSMSYRPSPVREVHIPKGNGKTRPLGISNLEDKLVQLMFSKILEAIYEPLFLDCSFGFRRGRSCHDAIKSCLQTHYKHKMTVIIDVDLENFFGTICHKKLISILRMKIKDERFIRYIVRMLKSGVLSDGELRKTDEGTPQGSCISPILANIYAHYAFDVWFEGTVKRYAKGRVEMHRYCDDIVISCVHKDDADKIQSSLQGRVKRFSLKMNEEKTQRINFSTAKAARGEKQGTFDFLGFTFYLGKSRKGFYLAKVKTSGKRIRNKLGVVKKWCRVNRHKAPLRKLWAAFCRKLKGHAEYYAVSDNSRPVSKFFFRAIKIFFKWMNRRSEKKSFDWEKFNRFLKSYPPPKIIVRHKMY